jgi:hypothetical protein
MSGKVHKKLCAYCTRSCVKNLIDFLLFPFFLLLSMVQIIDTIVISEIVEEGQARLQNLVNDYILRSVHIISIMKELLYVFDPPYHLVSFS